MDGPADKEHTKDTDAVPWFELGAQSRNTLWSRAAAQIKGCVGDYTRKRRRMVDASEDKVRQVIVAVPPLDAVERQALQHRWEAELREVQRRRARTAEEEESEVSSEELELLHSAFLRNWTTRRSQARAGRATAQSGNATAAANRRGGRAYLIHRTGSLIWCCAERRTLRLPSVVLAMSVGEGGYKLQRLHLHTGAPLEVWTFK